MARQTIGFIGLGDQGGPIARRIVDSGHELVLWARRPAALEPYADTAAVPAGSIAELAAACDIVGVCVFADADVAEVVEQLFSSMRAGGIILIHSTASPALCRDLAARGDALGLVVLDAPVSGGHQRAMSGELTVMVGGDPAAFSRVEPLIAAYATTVRWLGPPGSGQIAKLINNAMVTVNFASSLVFLEAGERLGLDRGALVESLSGGAAQSRGLSAMAAATPETLAFGLARLNKDVELMLDVLRDTALDDLRAAEWSRRGLADLAAYAAD